MRRLFLEVRRRLGLHAFVILALWPLATLLMAAAEIRDLPYLAVTPGQAFLGASAGVLILAPDFLVVGVLALLVSSGGFALLAAVGLIPEGSRRAIAAEPLILFLSTFFGIALCYPAVLANPVLTFARELPVLPVTAGIALVTVAGAMGRVGGWRGLVAAAAILAVGIAIPQPVSRQWWPRTVGEGRAPLVVLGLDSLSHHDDLSALHALSRRPDAAWYTHAVTPGLLTNAVWTSILLERPVREHGVFHTFQPFPQTTDSLLSRARAAGFRTVSVFPDQITCAVGSQAGFDDDRSGPVGWRQLTTQLVEDASLLLPVVRPMLPRWLSGPVPANHSGTFTYDVDRELDGIFGEGDDGGRALVVAHLTYLHSPRFPSYAELTPNEARRLWWMPAGEVRDDSFDWQDRHTSDDAFDLRSWKVRRLGTAVEAAIARTGFLAPARSGQLLVLADHGDRVDLTPDTFWKPEYHHVPLLTVGLPARLDTDTPVSLLDVGSLIGLTPADEPANDPKVEFTVSVPADWARLVNSVELAWDGSVGLDQKVLARIFRSLRSHRPWPARHPAQVDLVFASR